MAANKVTSSIQILGLGIGLGSVILMMSFILHEYSFDKYHKNSRNIYRVVYDKDCSTPYVMGELFTENIPEIEKTFRIYSLGNLMIKKDNELIKEKNFMLSDSTIFSLLDIPILSGNKMQLLKNNNDIVISEKSAAKYFGDKNPVGQDLELTISGNIVICQVSGVFKQFPSNSSIQPEFLGNIKLADYAIASQTLKFTSGGQQNGGDVLKVWEQRGFQTFLLIKDNQNLSSVEKKATLLCQKNDPDNKQKVIHLQQLTAMYFDSEELWNYDPLVVSNVKTIRLFEGIAILILLVAWFNYILLSTAETRSQLKEIACRKVIGASKGQITKKIYEHSFLVVFISLLPALLFTRLVIPVFNQLFEKNIDMGLLMKPEYLGAILCITIITGLAGGTYISIYSARLSPVSLFKNSISGKAKGLMSPSGVMIGFQFIVFIFLAGSAMFIAKQVKYSENKNQGFNSNNVIVFKLSNLELRKKVSILKTKLEANPHVSDVAISAFTPPHTNFIRLAIGTDKNAEPIKEEALFVGSDLIRLLQIPMLEGIGFEDGKDHSGEIIINESAAKKYEVTVGDKLGFFKIIGILKDFHIHSIHKPISPLFLMKMNDDGCYELTVRTEGNEKAVVGAAREIWTEIMPTALFEYELLNDRISSFYNKEKRQVKTISFFSFLAIFLSVIGLFSFVSITLIKRTKEIGIRKVNGARVFEVLAMLNIDFIKWIIIAFVIACPITWYAMNKWLENFAYKTDLSWWVFAVAGLLALIVALVTVSWQSWKAATRNPVESLRYE
jgi:putative ABC transport system permease protein